MNAEITETAEIFLAKTKDSASSAGSAFNVVAQTSEIELHADLGDGLFGPDMEAVKRMRYRRFGRAMGEQP